MEIKDSGLYIILCAVAVGLGVIAGNLKKPEVNATQTSSTTPATEANQNTTDETTETGIKNAKIAESGTGIKVVKAEDYAQVYPLQYESYMRNNENDEVVEYTEENPYIKTLYEGYGFAISYGSARGHTYVIEDITATGRPHKLANCYTCKTSDFTAAVLNEGDSAYAMAFEDFTNQITDPFGCFHCHGNDPEGGVITVTHGYLVNAVADDFDSIDAANLSCGQCHTEYYFDPATKATTLGYHGLDTMNPDDMLAYENSIVDGEGNMFADWVDENTGVRKLKVQHPEFETVLGEGSPHGNADSMVTFTCADCHMPKETAEDGTTYTSHYWISPLDNQELLDNTCAACHKDLAAEVKKIQDETTAKEDELGNKLAQLDADLAKAIEEGTIEGEDLENCRLACRNAQWFWDFVYVENSEGVHNMKLTQHCFEKTEEWMEEAYSYLK